MACQRFIPIIALLLIIITPACKKDTANLNCEQLKSNIAANNLGEVQTAIAEVVNRLPSKKHTAQNLQNLAAALSAQCLTAEVLCYGCIQTLPEQSEIRLSFTWSGAPVQKTIDIMNSPDNRMMVVGMHE